MNPIPAKYGYLRQEPLPPLMVRVALDMFGTLEKPGTADNPTILGWADEIARLAPSPYNNWAADFYDHDSIPWCGLFVAVCAVRAAQGRPERLPPAKYLSAGEWAHWGVSVDKASAVVGDIMVSARVGGNHVAIIIGEDETHFHILGGNQSDAVTITRKAKADVNFVRRPPYREQPPGARKVIVGAAGTAAAGREG